MRAVTANSLFDPSAAVARTVSDAFGLSESSSPSTSYVSNPVSPNDCRVWPAVNSSGSTPMPTRFDRWIRSNDSAITAFTPSRMVPLAAQSRDEPVPYSLPAITTSGVPCFWYAIAAS